MFFYLLSGKVCLCSDDVCDVREAILAVQRGSHVDLITLVHVCPSATHKLLSAVTVQLPLVCSHNKRMQVINGWGMWGGRHSLWSVVINAAMLRYA